MQENRGSCPAAAENSHRPRSLTKAGGNQNPLPQRTRRITEENPLESRANPGQTFGVYAKLGWGGSHGMTQGGGCAEARLSPRSEEPKPFTTKDTKDHGGKTA